MTLVNMVNKLTLAVWNAGINHVVITGTVKTDRVVAITASIMSMLDYHWLLLPAKEEHIIRNWTSTLTD